MYPAYHHGDRLLALRFWFPRSLRRGQVVVWNLLSESAPAFNPGGTKSYIKRIIGLPGDEVTAPVVRLSDPLEEEIWMNDAEQELKTWHIPAGHCFVKGDSPGFDSTVFGSLPIHCIRGVILARLKRVHHAPQFHALTNPPSPMERVNEP